MKVVKLKRNAFELTIVENQLYQLWNSFYGWRPYSCEAFNYRTNENN